MTTYFKLQTAEHLTRKNDTKFTIGVQLFQMMFDAEKNPVVMLNGTVWHIVEDGRYAAVAYCGQSLHDKRAHSRLKTVGETAVCAQCRQDYAPLQKSD